MTHATKNLSVYPCTPTHGDGIGLPGVMHEAKLITADLPATVEAADYLLASYARLPVGTVIDAVLGAGTANMCHKRYVVVTSTSAGITIKQQEVNDPAGILFKQGAPAAKTVSATLTAAELLAGLITVNQAAAGASALQLPLAADLDTALPKAAAGDAFDFSLINISTVDAEDATITTNTGWTLVGDIAVPALSAAGSLNTVGRFRARKTAAGAWTLYRIA